REDGGGGRRRGGDGLRGGLRGSLPGRQGWELQGGRVVRFDAAAPPQIFSHRHTDGQSYGHSYGHSYGYDQGYDNPIDNPSRSHGNGHSNSERRRPSGGPVEREGVGAPRLRPPLLLPLAAHDDHHHNHHNHNDNHLQHHYNHDFEHYLDFDYDYDYGLDHHEHTFQFDVDFGLEFSRGDRGRVSRVSRGLADSDTNEIETGAAKFVVVFINDVDESAAYGRGVDAAVKLLEDEGRQAVAEALGTTEDLVLIDDVVYSSTTA
ncbi:unnamed protein product, partial [Laminaria digitata]